MTWPASAHFGLAFLLAAAQIIRAQIDNPITSPKGGEIITAGTDYNITWTPTRGNIISIEIWNEISLASSFNGINCHFDDYNVDCSLLIENITNSGSYLWHVPANAPVASNYFLDIFVPNAGADGPFYFMTNNFSISNVGSPPTTTTSQASAATGTGSTSSHSGNVPFATAGDLQSSQKTTSQSGGLSPGALGGIIGAIIGGGVLIAACVGICFIMARRRRSRDNDRKRLTPLPSGRTAEGSFREKEEAPEAVIMDELQDNGITANKGIRYPDPDEDIAVPSARLQYNK